ncbi:hypothetical protein [Streptomyces rimosus]|uniref:hypothetical protein n=1 Tax=Streptomyces rimosus TaxID=1927 RepID=UPI0004C5880C|nr:hypothetical protein [Streptomyces rimosus]
MLQELRLNRAGVRELLVSDGVRQMVSAAAERIGARVRAGLPEGTDVVVGHYTTDRAASTVVIRSIKGMAWQARDGVLTRAAGAEGLDVRAWQR